MSIDTQIVTAVIIESGEDRWQRQPEWVWYDNETGVGLGRWSNGNQAVYVRADLVDEYVRLRNASS